MSRIFGSSGLVPASAIGGEPVGFCALCGGSRIDARARVDIQNMRIICGFCFEADAYGTARVAERLVAMDAAEQRALELLTAEPGAEWPT